MALLMSVHAQMKIEEEGCDKLKGHHVSLPKELIEKMKDVKSWEEWPCRWTLDEETITFACLWHHHGDNNHHFDRLANHDHKVIVHQLIDHQLGSKEIIKQLDQ
ncbi:hypothetical protein ACP275_06G211100 [Erythranthe tilingii]